MYRSKTVPLPGTTDLSSIDLRSAYKYTIYASDKRPVLFGDILNATSPSDVAPVADSSTRSSVPASHTSNRTLVVFIRHFFCGNCQEYLRRLSSSRLASSDSNTRVVIVGCGSPSLIESFRSLISIPTSWPIYTDPSTFLYELLGMQRTLSLGRKNPAYIQHSLANGMIKSIVQGMKRIPRGDTLGAGGLSVNGGEYLFERDENVGEKSIEEQWKLRWRHCMLNSRDHTEVEELLGILGFTEKQDGRGIEVQPITFSAPRSVRIQSSPILLGGDPVTYNTARRAQEHSHEKEIVDVQPEHQLGRRSSLRVFISARRQNLMKRVSTFAEFSAFQRSAGAPPT